MELITIFHIWRRRKKKGGGVILRVWRGTEVFKCALLKNGLCLFGLGKMTVVREVSFIGSLGFITHICKHCVKGACVNPDKNVHFLSIMPDCVLSLSKPIEVMAT